MPRLLELSHQVLSTVQLDGFDISCAMFSQKALLPPIVSLETLDAFSDVPVHLVGNYDMTHTDALYAM